MPVLPETPIGRILRAATLAPSGHNTQPWRFAVADGEIRIAPDRTRRLPVVDPDDHALYVSLGCALENLVVAARHEGLEADVVPFPGGEDHLSVRLRPAPSPGGAVPDGALHTAIFERQSTRSRYDGRPLSPAEIDALRAAAAQGGVEMRVLAAPGELEPVIQLVEAANRIQFGDRSFVEELVSWIRFNGREVARHRDGLDSRVMGLPRVPRWLGRFFVTRLTSGEREARKTARLVRSSSALLLFVADRDDREAWVGIGRSFERVALASTAMGLRHAHVNMPCEVVEVRRELARRLGLGGREPLLLVRIGRATPMPRSPRRRIEEVVDGR